MSPAVLHYIEMWEGDTEYRVVLTRWSPFGDSRAYLLIPGSLDSFARVTIIINWQEATCLHAAVHWSSLSSPCSGQERGDVCRGVYSMYLSSYRELSRFLLKSSSIFITMNVITSTLVFIIAAISFFTNSSLASRESSVSIGFEFLCNLNLTLGESVEIGNGPFGSREAIPVTGGAFYGPELTGRPFKYLPVVELFEKKNWVFSLWDCVD